MRAQINRRRTVPGLATFTCALSLAFAVPVANAEVIGFDEQVSGTVLDEQYAKLGVHFGPSPFADVSGKLTAVSRPAQARSGPNVGAFAYDTFNDFSSSWIRFDKLQRRVSFYACRTGGGGDPPQPNLNVDAYDSAGNVIANQQGIPCNLNGPLVAVTVETPGIAYINVAGIGGSAAPGAGWALDDLEFEIDPPPPPPPPAPADTDGDGIADTSDNCPDVANADQLDGDGDGIGTACDTDEDVDLPATCLEPAKPNLIGTIANDILIGTDDDDTLTGLEGDDCIAGRAGNDGLDGDAGEDALYGESGRDTVLGGSGDDRLSGGSSDDRLSGSSGDDRLVGASGDDRISGGTGKDRISGGTGGDAIAARDGDRDKVDCGSGRDSVTADRSDRVDRDCERVTRR